MTGSTSAGTSWREGSLLPDNRPHTLESLHARMDPAWPCLVDAGRTWTRGEIARHAAALADRWRSTVVPGAVVAIALGNGVAHLIAREAAWRLGAVAAPLDPALPTGTSTALLARLRPCLIAGAEDEARMLTGDLVPVEDRWSPRPPDAPCLILITSGSSGRPKAVRLSQDNLCSQQSAYAALWPDAGPLDRLASYLPWHHSFGGLAECLWAQCRGMVIHVVPGGGHDHDLFLDFVHQIQPTRFLSVPRLHRVLCASGRLRTLTSLRWAFTAGAPLANSEAEAYARAGIALCEGWGLTEASPSCCITRPGAPRQPGLVGPPIPGTSVGIRADGHILICGPNVMLDYLDDPAATAAVLRGGVLDSGDHGTWSDAGLILRGRGDQRLSLENGEKIAADTIEARLTTIPGIRHALAFVHLGRLTAWLDSSLSIDALAEALHHANSATPIPWQRLRQAWCKNRPWSVQDGELTPTHKVARTVLAARDPADVTGWTEVLPSGPEQAASAAGAAKAGS